MYRWIQRWGELVGISSEEILATLVHAWADAAPADAVYREGNGTWKTLADLGEPALAALAALGVPAASAGAMPPRAAPGVTPSTALADSS